MTNEGPAMPDSDTSAPTTKSLLLKAIHERDYETIDQLLSKGHPSAFKINREFTDKEREETKKNLAVLLTDDKRRWDKPFMLLKSILDKRLEKITELYEEDQKAETPAPDMRALPAVALSLYGLQKRAEEYTTSMSLPSLAQDHIKLTI
ncbi:MAG: hypothetical protein Q9203_003362 [Teloschistes exilis]